MRALLIDDDAALGRLLVEYLAKNEVSLEIRGDGAAGLEELSRDRYDLVLLDVMLPGIDGLEVCRRIRARPEHAALPVLMLTARGDDVDKVVGLELGADDYLAKPFNPRELLARMRALHRRAQATTPGKRARVRLGEIEIDVEARTVRVGERDISLTSFEFDLLAALAEAAGRVLSREFLIERLRHADFDTFDRSIDVHISRLRAKIEPDPKTPRYIKTVRGAGYVLAKTE